MIYKRKKIMGKQDVILHQFRYTEEPLIKIRTPHWTDSPEELLSIKQFPYISCNKVGFDIDFEINETDYSIHDEIPKGTYYNFADIPWIAEPLSFDKHSPFVKDASFIHDFLISNKRRLYNKWELKDKGVSKENFRVLTSLIFAYQLRQNGVHYNKAHQMAFFVDLWQSLLPGWRTLDKLEIKL